MKDKINKKPNSKNLLNSIKENKKIGKGFYVDYDRNNYPEKYNDIAAFLINHLYVPNRYKSKTKAKKRTLFKKRAREHYFLKDVRFTVESTYFKGQFNKNNKENENADIYMLKDFEETGNDLLKSILDYEKLMLSDNLLRSEYQTLENARKHIAQIIKFNEDRFKFNFGLKDFINNIEEQKKWMTIKDINELRNKIENNKNNHNINFNNKKKKINNNKYSLNKNKTNINLKNNNIKFEEYKIITIDDLNSKLNNKTNRTPFRTNNLMINHIKNKINQEKNNNTNKRYNNKFHFEINSFSKIEKEKKENIKNKPKLLKPLKNNG